MRLMATSTQQRGRRERRVAGSSCHLEPLQTNPMPRAVAATPTKAYEGTYGITALPGTLVSGHLHPVLRPASRASCVLPCLVNWSFPCPFEGELDNRNNKLPNHFHQTSPIHRERPARQRRTVQFLWTLLQRTIPTSSPNLPPSSEQATITTCITSQAQDGKSARSLPPSQINLCAGKPNKIAS